MPRTLILSDSRRETYAYAKSIGLRSRQVEHATSADSIRGVHFPVVIELPSYSSRRDRHAINAVVKAMATKFNRIKGKDIDFQTADFVYTRPAPQIAGELPGQTTIDDFIEPVEMPSPPEPETKPVEMPSPPEPKTKPVKMPEAPRPKRTPRKAVAKATEPKPKTGSNALEPSSVDAFFQGS